MRERLTASPSGRCVTEGPMLVAPREVLVCCVLPWSFPARVSCPMLRFTWNTQRPWLRFGIKWNTQRVFKSNVWYSTHNAALHPVDTLPAHTPYN